MELLCELADTQEKRDKNFLKDGVTCSGSDELETLMNDRSFG